MQIYFSYIYCWNKIERKKAEGSRETERERESGVCSRSIGMHESWNLFRVMKTLLKVHGILLQKEHVFVIVDISVNLSLILVFILKIDFRVKSQKRMLTTLVCVGKGIAKSRYRWAGLYTVYTKKKPIDLTNIEIAFLPPSLSPSTGLGLTLPKGSYIHHGRSTAQGLL